ncbi:metallophosphoesterase family protein [Aurantimonas coralicida]|uniref:metallophosphoesterase family protein n=1 Tax=Aurantimonas coralicida TaxID=182270 RepID=UPI001D18776C|nr:metallophosphoesterase [Aurantimonas coralicida]MCC4296628.1 metallophosphoesterase [Aurantimonas coralicida]
MLPRLRILQIGDVHLPSGINAQPFVDVKDVTFPSGLTSIIATSPLKRVFKRVFKFLESGQVDALLFMGDLTDYGNLDAYTACCRYIASALQIGNGRRFAHIPVGFVPGNHDIDRTLARRPGTTTKFTPLVAALNAVGLPDLPILQPKVMDVGISGQMAKVFLLNSCWGCGDEARIPERFRAPIASAIDSVIAGASGDAAIKDYYDRQLDTPALSENSIAKLMQGVHEAPSNILPIIVAHHNLLPQRLPRLAPYTELVNGGALRASLGELGRPVLYLHGHIHEDPIEIIRSPGGPPVISISAPKLSDGFNVIDLIYSPQSLPLACHVIPVRFDQSGILKIRPRIALPLNDSRRHMEPSLTNLYWRLLERRTAYWSDVEVIASTLNGHPVGEALVAMVEQLFADDLITIDNSDLAVENWIVRTEM